MSIAGRQRVRDFDTTDQMSGCGGSTSEDGADVTTSMSNNAYSDEISTITLGQYTSEALTRLGWSWRAMHRSRALNSRVLYRILVT